MGYHVAWVAPPGKDRGIDILAWSDPLGTRPPRIKIQVKRHEENIPAAIIAAAAPNICLRFISSLHPSAVSATVSF